jgi:hypothetical protein
MRTTLDAGRTRTASGLARRRLARQASGHGSPSRRGDRLCGAAVDWQTDRRATPNHLLRPGRGSRPRL